MRKRSCNRLFDNIFWYTLYLLPIIAYLLSLLMYQFNDVPSSDPAQIVNFSNFMFNYYDIINNNVIVDVFSSIFSEEGLIPFFNEIGFISYLGWFIIVYLCHLLVDFLLFIPRLCHKWLKAFTQGDD